MGRTVFEKQFSSWMFVEEKGRQHLILQKHTEQSYLQMKTARTRQFLDFKILNIASPNDEWIKLPTDRILEFRLAE
jgi:hypothetical protein